MSENEKKTEEIVDEATDEVVEEATADVVEEEAVKSEVEVLQEKLDELEDKFLRASAEIANITTRNRNEREQLQKYRSQDLAKKLLTSVDNLERAMAIEVHDEQAASLKKESKKFLLKVKLLIQHYIKQFKLFLRLMSFQQILL